MSKTPPLVIPVVIDGTGVNRGLNNVNSRLRKGVSGGASGGGFGSGGGDALAVAAAAGIGAGIGASGMGGAARHASAMTPIQKLAAKTSEQLSYRRNNFISRAMQSFAEKNFDIARTTRDRILGNAPYLNRTWEGNNIPDVLHHQNVGKVFGGRAERLGRGVARFRNARESLLNRISPTNLSSLGLSRSALIGGGIGGAVTLGAMGAARFATNAATTANSESVIGNQNYGTMRGIQITEALRRPNLSFGQGVLAGARNVTGGPSSIEMVGSLLRQGYEGAGLGIGTAIETIFNAFAPGGSQVQAAWRHAYFKKLGN
jgi:hypothetical protein